MNLAQKIISAHLVAGEMIHGAEIGIRIDQSLTQDATGTMAYLEFEAMGVEKVRTRLSVSYVDHNILQTGFENADDHRFLQSMAARYSAYFSRPGNGICHQVHLERFARPGETLIGSDSHTPNAGAVGMLAIGAGGLDVAASMAGEPFYMIMPKVVNVRLKGRLGPWTSAKDIILELLRRLSVKGGVGKVFEYSGDGLGILTVPERATIANMGAELGATTSIFPSDEQTRLFLKAQGREAEWMPMAADDDAGHDDEIQITLDALEPLLARPSNPDNVVPVRECVGTPVGQVCIGSCVNSSYMDLMLVARILKGKKIHPDVSLTVNPGSRQSFMMIAKNGLLSDLISAGARILECACGPCIGMGQAPATGIVSLRTFNRNFPGRSGTAGDRVYLCSPATAAASALTGVITNPRDFLGRPIRIKMPEEFLVDDSMIIPPSKEPEKVQIIRGPNIKPLPKRAPIEDVIRGIVLLKTGDNITTDDIMPAGAKILPLRSNIPAISEYTFTKIDPRFPLKAKEHGGGIIIGGSNYGQGSSREHAALAPMYLGVKAVLARSFARIHRDNLINFGIIPFVIKDDVYNTSDEGDAFEFPSVVEDIKTRNVVRVVNKTKGISFDAVHNLTQRQREIILCGGLLNYVKRHA